MDNVFKVLVGSKSVVNYNLDLFEEHLEEIRLRAMRELEATAISKNLISLPDYKKLSPLNDLIVSYLH